MESVWPGVGIAIGAAALPLAPVSGVGIAILAVDVGGAKIGPPVAVVVGVGNPVGAEGLVPPTSPVELGAAGNIGAVNDTASSTTSSAGMGRGLTSADTWKRSVLDCRRVVADCCLEFWNKDKGDCSRFSITFEVDCASPSRMTSRTLPFGLMSSF